MNALLRNNQLPGSLNISEGFVLQKLPDLKFQPKEYDAAQDAREVIEGVLSRLPDLTKAKIDIIKSISDEEKAMYQREIDTLNSDISEYSAMIKTEVDTLDVTKKKINTIKDKRSLEWRTWIKEINSAIIDSSVAVPVLKSYDLDSFYYFLTEARCKRKESNVVRQIDQNDKSLGCVELNQRGLRRADLKDKGLDDIIFKHTILYAQFSLQLKKLKMHSRATRKVLKSKKIIARNKTGIDEKKINKKIRVLNSKIKNTERSFQRNSDVEDIQIDILRNSTEFVTANKSYYDAYVVYQKTAKAHAFNNVELDINEISDENDLFEYQEKHGSLILYNFADENNEKKSITYVVQTGKRNQDMSFIDIFQKNNRNSQINTKIEGEDDIRTLLSKM